jgi:transcriptional regulator with XRE-family HTH domain
LSTTQWLAVKLDYDDNKAVPKRKVAPTPPELLTLPSRLKYARERAGMTRLALAQKAGLDPAQITRYEKAERLSGMEAATIIRLARALGAPVGWLAADEGSLPAPVFREDGESPEPRGSKR